MRSSGSSRDALGHARPEQRAAGRRGLTGHPGGACPDPRHQTTVEPIAPSDLPSGPKMRPPRGALPAADPEG